MTEPAVPERVALVLTVAVTTTPGTATGVVAASFRVAVAVQVPDLRTSPVAAAVWVSVPPAVATEVAVVPTFESLPATRAEVTVATVRAVADAEAAVPSAVA